MFEAREVAGIAKYCQFQFVNFVWFGIKKKICKDLCLLIKMFSPNYIAHL